MTIANKKLVELGKAQQKFIAEMSEKFSVLPEVMGSFGDFEIQYDGPEGVIVTAFTNEARDFWANGLKAVCGADQIEPYYVNIIVPESEKYGHYFISKESPILICLPFTDDPEYSRQSANHGSFVDSAGDVKIETADTETLAPFDVLLAAAVKDNPQMSVLLTKCGFAENHMPHESWGHNEFMDIAIEQWPFCVAYIPEEFLTADVFIRCIKSAREGWALSGCADVIHETLERFEDLLTDQQWQDLEKDVPGVLNIRRQYYEGDSQDNDSISGGPERT